MQIIGVKTALVSEKGGLADFLFESLENTKKTFNQSNLEESIIVISSKIISILEGNMVKLNEIKVQNSTLKMLKKNYSGKNEDPALAQLIENEADYIIPGEFYLTIKNNIIIPSAGIDISNVPNGTAVLWPKNPQKTADNIRNLFIKKYNLKNFGVIISDSRITPMRKGVTGIALAWSGFIGVEDIIGKKDLFNKTITVTTKAVADNLTSAAILIMGEADESTPISIITNAPIIFTDKQQSQKDAIIKKSEDLFPNYMLERSPSLNEVS